MDLRLSGRASAWLGAVLFLLLCLAAPANALDSAPPPGAAPALATLSVALWPEYDRPEMLVIYWGEFADDVSLPVAVEWRIPATAGGPSALAANDPEKGLLNLDYTSREEGDWLVLSFELSTPGFQVEYYAPLVESGDERSYVFAYPGDYPVWAFSLSAQQPRTAQQFALEPAASAVSEGADGLTYHEVQGVPLAQGEARSWTVRYVKADALLSSPAEEPAQAAATPPPAGAAGTGDSTVWIFLIAFVALAAVGAGAFWLGRRSGSSPSEGAEGQAPYCHVCGARIPVDARFCPKCAAPVRDR